MVNKTKSTEERPSKRRSPKDWTPEMREQAIARLNDENFIFLDFTDGCVLLNISKSFGYEKARAGELPGVVRSLKGSRLGNQWQFRRIPLKKYLYGEE